MVGRGLDAVGDLLRIAGAVVVVDAVELGDLEDLAQAREVVRAGAGPEIRRLEPSAFIT